MKTEIEILRRESPTSDSYTQSFTFEYENMNTTAARALTEINIQISEGRYGDTKPVRWECSCLQKKCGACAMLINGYPALACDTKLSAFKGVRVTLAPLKKFPVIADLIVDRTQMMNELKKISAWLNEDALHGEKRDGLAYDASRCLQCGCCLEVCPNFYTGGSFSGTAAAIPASRIIAETDPKKKNNIYKKYGQKFFEGCGKSLACRKVCPAGIDVDRLLANSNSAAVWKALFRR